MVAALAVGITLLTTEGSDTPSGSEASESEREPAASAVPRSDTDVAIASVLATASAAVLVALLGIGAARNRQDRALDDERARLAAQLENDRTLRTHEERLAEDRDLRVLLEEAASELQATRRTLETLARLWHASVNFSSPDAQEAHQKWLGRIQEVRLIKDRVTIRLGRRSTVTLAFKQAVGALDGYQTLVGKYKRGEPFDSESNEQRKHLIHCQNAFLDAAQARVGLDEPQEDEPADNEADDEDTTIAPA